jgi:hypothetical protein
LPLLEVVDSVRLSIYVGPSLFSFVDFLAEGFEAGVEDRDRAGGRMGDGSDGEEGAEVGDVGLVWGENVILGGEGGSRVVEVVICTISVSIYHQHHPPFFLSSIQTGC